MARSLVTLPEELLSNVASFLDNDDLGSLRLTCKQLVVAATHALFSLVRLCPSDDSLEFYHRILEHPEFSKHARHVELNTLDENESEEEEGGTELSDDFSKALGLFKKLPNLTSATLRFSENASSGDMWSEWPQDCDFRQPILRQFFKTLSHPSASKINDICIDNLQNINETGFMQSPEALKVMSRLKALRLYVVTEHHSAAPELDLEMDELHSFMAELRPLWLEPASSNLTTLVLYQTNFHFGYCPRLDIRGLRFPHLHTLALGNYVFSHDWQLEWLSSHSSTLRNLYLDDCIIVYYSRLFDCLIDADGYPVMLNGHGGTTRGPGTCQNRFYDLTWSRVFTHLRTSLINLRHFRIGKSRRWDLNNNLFDRAVYEDLHIGIFPDRYMIFNMGIGPYQYTTSFAEQDGKGTEEGDKACTFSERWVEQDTEDSNALNEVLKAIGQPILTSTN
ncbi:F-box domain cyclin-containing protein [Neofusicoccum parvum]|nr:F-box domain cyclin-containing protein [Neofusicoccum parvum]